MQYENVAQLFAANAEMRKQFLDAVREISEDEASEVPEGEKWSIKQIVEHVAMVDHGVARICGRLISEAKRAGNLSGGRIAISPQLIEHAVRIAGEKLEAPEQVQPTGNRSISESIGSLQANQQVFETMREDLETYDLSQPKFPHPYFGPMTAIEWLLIAGRHEMRHTQQLQRLLTMVRK